MKNLFYSLIKFSLLLFPAAAFAQTSTDTVEMADVMRSNGKLYVVVAVLLIIFCGLAVYLINIDRRVRKLEKEKE